MKFFQCLTGASTLLLLALLPNASSANTTTGTLKFEVALDDKPIGEHVLTFSRNSDRDLEIDIAIDLAVKFGPFTVFDYTHRNESQWRDGLLQSMQSETNDNGDIHTVVVESLVDQLRVVTDDINEYATPTSTLPTTYWMASTISQNRLINSQTGELLDIEITEVGREDVSGPDGPISATRYKMEGDLKIELWYDDTGILVGLAFQARGSEVTYRLIERQGLLPVAAAMPNLTARN